MQEYLKAVRLPVFSFQFIDKKQRMQA